MNKKRFEIVEASSPRELETKLNRDSLKEYNVVLLEYVPVQINNNIKVEHTLIALLEQR